MLEIGDPTDRIRTLMAERAPAYDAVATVRVSGDDRVASDVVEEIVEKLAAWAREHPQEAGRGPIDDPSSIAPGNPSTAHLAEEADLAIREPEPEHDLGSEEASA